MNCLLTLLVSTIQAMSHPYRADVRLMHSVVPVPSLALPHTRLSLVYRRLVGAWTACLRLARTAGRPFRFVMLWMTRSPRVRFCFLSCSRSFALAFFSSFSIVLGVILLIGPAVGIHLVFFVWGCVRCIGFVTYSFRVCFLISCLLFVNHRPRATYC